MSDFFNDTTNTAAGINTPPDHQDQAVTDPVADAVAEIIDNLTAAFTGVENEEDQKL
ncbi:hypothetical protein MJA45_15675 [Paenibacillus aurantius]|uniref:Uncharacterized protein n=1 Tax=Paenibacillus aurantius TaxID=2918900 RepID=A0AA96RD65_9BACL|nr:hypothetical protein [Paenibacillus aurantius]WNQ09086.1 hypothetical protein MJA45_15675 [Paenibacillus aurantius]